MADVTQLAEQKQSFSVCLTEKLDGMLEALPKDFNKSRFVTNALALVNDKPELVKDYGQAQVMSGLVKGAVLGLDFYNKECHLVGYGKSLNFQLDYRGAKKLAKKYSIRPIQDIFAKIVRKGDVFSSGVKDGKQTVDFAPIAFNDDEIIGAFAVCYFQDGGMLVDTMSLAELENTRRHSKASNSPAWRDYTGEMYKKTVLHRLCKQIEIDFESPTQRATFDEDMEIETDTQAIIENKVAEEQATVPFDDGFDGVEDAEVRDAE